MQYEMVNEKLKLATCSISDLTLGQAVCFLESWGTGTTLGTLTMFCLDDGTIVLNKNNENYAEYLEMVESYLMLDASKRIEVRKNTPKSLEETFELLDRCIKKRFVNEELLRIEQNLCPSDKYMLVLSEIRNSCKDDDITWKIVQAFNYGLMSGKRIERAKRTI